MDDGHRNWGYGIKRSYPRCFWLIFFLAILRSIRSYPLLRCPLHLANLKSRALIQQSAWRVGDTKMTNTNQQRIIQFSKLLRRVEAWPELPELQEWAEGKTIAAAWRTCKCAEWLLWLACQMAGQRDQAAGWPTRQQVVLACCACADTALPIFEKKYPTDPRPRRTIAIARAWANGGNATGLRAAARAARAASRRGITWKQARPPRGIDNWSEAKLANYSLASHANARVGYAALAAAAAAACACGKVTPGCTGPAEAAYQAASYACLAYLKYGLERRVALRWEKGPTPAAEARLAKAKSRVLADLVRPMLTTRGLPPLTPLSARCQQETR
jgi:hypothetical protein